MTSKTLDDSGIYIYPVQINGITLSVTSQTIRKVALSDKIITNLSADANTQFVHLSGDNNIGTLQLSGSLDIGTRNSITGANSVAIGYTVDDDHARLNKDVTLIGNSSVGIGTDVLVMGNYAMAHGKNVSASGTGSHAEGLSAFAYKDASHAEGIGTKANGYGSHAAGYETTTYNAAECAVGTFNNTTKDTVSTDNINDIVAAPNNSNATVFSVGIGTSRANKKNGFEVTRDGTIKIWYNN